MILQQALPLPPVNRQAILGYAGARAESPALTALLDETLAELLPQLTGQVCWGEFPIVFRGDALELGFAVTQSAALARHLDGCSRVLVFAATVGLAPDRLIARYAARSPAKALLAQAIGAERIEALCDSFCQQLRQEYGPGLTGRFSPGYGDLPLALQADIFRVLDCPRKIGLTLNQSLLMSPSKSVTALVGLTDRRMP